ncbi:protein kinase [Chrysochromulina tobinii]|uniref:Protein kinase n=1 Tax=Chrysochromulina tobinii TaxID=1460289 RepID=A0A0M0J3A8_9EUKA|nr:protein kinase [Chrysochromulina tobinii]|eukprot:KOO20995.1 protein kinase [Chrysochromulina sp. CCMP291]
MDAICGRPGDYSLEDSTCLCRPSYRFEGISLEHGTLGIVQLAKAAYLIVWLRMHRRGAVHDSSEHSSLMVLPVYARFLKFEMALGVFTSSWLVSDAIALPLAWIAYTPFLTWVLARDSRYWSRCGFTACLMGDATAGRVATAPHRVPLLAARSSGSGFAPRFIIVDPSKLRFGVRIGQGSSSIVSAATLYGELVAVKQMEVSRLTREFASMFLTEAECLSHCRHPHIVRFVGGCVAPPLVCLVMEQCESSVHRLVHPRRSAAARHMRLAPLPDKVVCELLRGVVSGMAFLHDVMGITHGDLKPLNMLLRGNCVKLCDFGSSRLLQHDLSELAFSATLPYMAPELLVRCFRLCPFAPAFPGEVPGAGPE